MSLPSWLLCYRQFFAASASGALTCQTVPFFCSYLCIAFETLMTQHFYLKY
jgi:hypothetical protein